MRVTRGGSPAGDSTSTGNAGDQILEFDNILLDEPEPGIRILTVNRPKVLNALNGDTVREIGEAVGALTEDAQALALIVTGAGDKSFVAGADIAEMQGYSPLQARRWAQSAMAVFRRLELLPFPVIAAVNGYALGGGCELAMSCDFVVAGERAVFGQPEVNLGVTPGFGGTQRLSRLVGRAMAIELTVTGRQVAAAEAQRIGLVNHVFADTDLMEEALTIARTIASRGPVAVRLAKEAIQRGQDLDLENACALESEIFALCFATRDQREGMAAFLERRKPDFEGE